MVTHTFKLPSGVECEISEFRAKHQEMLTIGLNSKKFSDRLDEIIRDVVVRIGSNTNITPEVVKSLLACDKKKILIECRFFSLGFEPFEFNYEYKNEKGEKKQHRVVIDFGDEGFKTIPVKRVSENGDIVDADYTELDQIEKDVEIILPRSQEKVRFTMLDGKGEQIMATINRKNISSSTPLEIRRPVKFHIDATGKEIPIKLRLGDLSLADIEFLRKSIKQMEGDVDSSITFERPEDDDTGNTPEITLDVTQVTAFFFPSGAI